MLTNIFLLQKFKQSWNFLFNILVKDFFYHFQSDFRKKASFDKICLKYKFITFNQGWEKRWSLKLKSGLFASPVNSSLKRNL